MFDTAAAALSHWCRRPKVGEAFKSGDR